MVLVYLCTMWTNPRQGPQHLANEQGVLMRVRSHAYFRQHPYFFHTIFQFIFYRSHTLIGNLMGIKNMYSSTIEILYPIFVTHHNLLSVSPILSAIWSQAWSLVSIVSHVTGAFSFAIPELCLNIYFNKENTSYNEYQWPCAYGVAWHAQSTFKISEEMEHQ